MPEISFHPHNQTEELARGGELERATPRNPSPLSPVFLDPATPPARFLAAAAPVVIESSFEPEASHLKLAEHLFESNAASFVELAEASGVSRTQIWRILKDRRACAWIVAHATGATELGLGAVHARLLHLALTSRNPSAIELYLRRFDPGYQRADSRPQEGAIGTQFNVIAQMSAVELLNFVKQHRRKEGLADDSRREDRAGPGLELLPSP